MGAQGSGRRSNARGASQKKARALSSKVSSAARAFGRSCEVAALWGGRRIKRGYERLLEAVESSGLSAKTRKAMTDCLSLLRAAAQKGKHSLDLAAATVNAVLASDFSKSVERLLERVFGGGAPTIYDKSIDAVYNATHIGGGKLHRIVDGSHTIWQMWEKVSSALPNDSLIQEMRGFVGAFLKDLFTPEGIPIVSLSVKDYNSLANALAKFHIPRRWLRDMLQVNGPELVGAAVAIVPVVLCFSRRESKAFQEFVGSIGVSAIAGANPLLSLLFVAAAALALLKARKGNRFRRCLTNMVRGGLVTAAFIAASSFVGEAVWIGIFLCLVIGVILYKLKGSVSLHDVARYLREAFSQTLDAAQSLSRKAAYAAMRP